MVSFTANENLSSGELSSLDQRFVSVINYLPLMIFVGIICIIGCMILPRLNKTKLSFLARVGAIIIFIGSVVLFFVAMSLLSNVTVGSVFGTGDVEISIPGEDMYQTLNCIWGLNIGYYLVCFSIILLIIEFILYLKRKK